ncbi:hypothetical protein [Allokutzneria oryzae]|uniref:D-isomer specific 2-hydroxyacid dehydrogenase catalytic domain-containing protein n=1 Tax=Allokutzneria oryzae TaxID=1378989 RepID=A0ABV5ZVS3_9PSEU
MKVLVLNDYRLSTLPDPEWLGPGAEVGLVTDASCLDAGLIAMSELDLLRAARVRERVGVAGQDVAGATAFTDKVVMKRAPRA